MRGRRDAKWPRIILEMDVHWRASHRLVLEFASKDVAVVSLDFLQGVIFDCSWGWEPLDGVDGGRGECLGNDPEGLKVVPTYEYLATQVVDDDGVEDGGDPCVGGGVDEDFTQARERRVVNGEQDWL